MAAIKKLDRAKVQAVADEMEKMARRKGEALVASGGTEVSATCDGQAADSEGAGAAPAAASGIGEQGQSVGRSAGAGPAATLPEKYTGTVHKNIVSVLGCAKAEQLADELDTDHDGVLADLVAEMRVYIDRCRIEAADEMYE